MRNYAIAFLIGLFVSGCQINASPKPPMEEGWRPDTVNANYGEYPSNYEEIIKNWYMQNLKDPNSAMFVSISKPRKEHAIENQFAKAAIFGYSVCASVNAKNSYGGYTGAQTKWFLIRNGTVMKYQDPKYPIYIGHPVNCSDS